MAQRININFFISFFCIYILLFRPSDSDIFEQYYVDASLLLFALMLGQNVKFNPEKNTRVDNKELAINIKLEGDFQSTSYVVRTCLPYLVSPLSSLLWLTLIGKKREGCLLGIQLSRQYIFKILLFCFIQSKHES